MKTVFLPILTIGSFLFIQSTHAKPVKFDHSGVKVGSIIESCYHNPCSGAKITDFKKLSSSNNSAMLELTLLGFSQSWNSKKKQWNTQPHKVFITCSINNPTVTIDGQVTILPIGSEYGIPGVLYTDYTFYISACHGKDNLDEIKLAKKYGYHVEE